MSYMNQIPSLNKFKDFFFIFRNFNFWFRTCVYFFPFKYPQAKIRR